MVPAVYIYHTVWIVDPVFGRSKVNSRPVIVSLSGFWNFTRLAQIHSTVSDTVDRYINQWVTGGVTDENWNAYLNELEAAGVNEIVSIYQTAVDRSTK